MKLSMKSRLLIPIVAVAIMAALIAGPAIAAEKMLETTINSVTVATDKNGNEYVRCIISEGREVNGIAYTRDLPLMFFGEMVDAGKALTAGQTIKVIASYREWESRPSYTALKIIP